MPTRLSARHRARRCSAEAVQTTMRPKLALISLLAAAGASEQEIRLTRGLDHTTTETRRPPAPPAGPAALLPFRDRCVSTQLGADDLRVCPFANATQTSLAGAARADDDVVVQGGRGRRRRDELAEQERDEEGGARQAGLITTISP